MRIFIKVLFALVLFVSFSFAKSAFAMAPTFSLTTDPNNSSYVQINVTGDANSGVILRYYSTTASGQLMHSIGVTNASGNFSGSIALTDYNITQNSAVGVTVNGQSSSNTTWPYTSSTATTTFSLSQGSVVLTIGQSTTITTSNTTSNALYLSSNTNPQVANIAFNGNQITVTGLSTGQTTANICVINSSSSQNCASLYILTQGASSQLLFSQNNTSIISGQNIQINITGGNGFYQVQNNTNASLISTSLNGPVLTLYANGSTGSTTVTVCSTDMNACGVVNASIGTYTSSGTGLSFSQSYPTITTNQTAVINISGGYGAYYVSSNSNSSIVQTYISTSTVTLYGNAPGTASVTVCAPSGQCGIISANVVASSGGVLTLSQTSVGLTVGQVISVTITGGTVPYSVIQNNDGKAQYSLSGSTVTVTGVSSGSSSATVCSAAGGCIVLNASVSSSSSGSAVSGVQPVFSQNNVSINTNQTTAIYLTGNGGYYVSNNSNPAIITASISGNSLVISGIAVGSANISVCQTGGQCNTLYVTVSNAAVSTVSSVPVTFDKTSVSLNEGGSTIVNVTGGSGVGYYISYNSSLDVIGVYVNASSLIITGKSAGSGTISVCSSANVCASLAISVTAAYKAPVYTAPTETTTVYKFTKALKLGSTGTEVTQLQKKLKELGFLSGSATGYYGSLTAAAVKKFQKLHKLEQLGSVGPGTRAELNK